METIKSLIDMITSITGLAASILVLITATRDRKGKK